MTEHENNPVPGSAEPLPETDGSGRADGAESLEVRAKTEAIEAGHTFAAKFPSLRLKQRQQLATAFRGGLIPRRKPGKRPKKEISAAYADWSKGMRGPAFYQTHIPNYSKMGRWHRESEERRLKEAMRSRERRSRRTGADNQQSVSAA